jgi:hypothetical protein
MSLTPLPHIIQPQGTFWLRAFPVYAHYRLTEMVMRLKGLNQEEQNEVWDKLHAKHADEMLTLVKRLKGYYVKVRPCSVRPWLIFF